MEEKVLVVKKNLIDSFGEGHNLILVEENEFKSVVNENIEFLLRRNAENDFTYKQVIPYVVFFYKDSIFCTFRKNKQTEKRLHSKLSIGIGGHINDNDVLISTGDIVERGMIRELNEEIYIYENINPMFVGIINNNEIEVDSVHVGACFFVTLETDNLEIKEDEKMDGQFVSLNYLDENYDRLEEWSKIVYDYIKGIS